MTVMMMMMIVMIMTLIMTLIMMMMIIQDPAPAHEARGHEEAECAGGRLHPLLRQHRQHPAPALQTRVSALTLDYAFDYVKLHHLHLPTLDYAKL